MENNIALQNKIARPLDGAENSRAFTGIDHCIQVLCFISILLIGADRWGIDIGVNLRIDQFFLALLTIFLVLRGGYRWTWNLWIVVFLISSLVATLFAYNFVRGAAFYFSILYNVVFLFYAFQSYVRLYGLKKLVQVFRCTMYVQFVIMLMQVGLKIVMNFELPFLPSYGEYFGVPRFSLWFYEPSYLATYLSIWFTFSLYMLLIGKTRSYWIDTVMALLMLLLSTASTGFIAIILACIVVYVLWVLKGVTWQKLLFPILVVVAFIIFRFAFENIYTVFFERLFNQSLDSVSGGRISLWAETWKVFTENPIFGVGPGNYGLYLGQDAGKVPSNVTLDLLATVGIVATVAFYALTFMLCYRAYRVHKEVNSEETRMLVALAVSLVIFTIVLQANQGYLRLYHWMMFGILSGGVCHCKQINK